MVTNGNLASHNLQHSVNSNGIFFKGGEDLDTFMEPGTWNCNSYNVAQSLIHTPPLDTFGSGFRFDVFASSSGGRVQRIIVHDTIPKIFYRSKFSDTWNNWEKIVSNADFDSVGLPKPKSVTDLYGILNTDLQTRFNPIRIDGATKNTFSSVLKDKCDNAVNFIAFAENAENPITDNPFSFASGYVIVFHSGLIRAKNIFTAIGVSADAEAKIEMKRLDLRS